MFQIFISDYKKWLSEHCFFENTCHFKHDLMKQNLKSNVREVISSHQNINCQYWLRENCKLQNKCWYWHDSNKKNNTLKDLNATNKKNINLFFSYIFFDFSSYLKYIHTQIIRFFIFSNSLKNSINHICLEIL